MLRLLGVAALLLVGVGCCVGAPPVTDMSFDGDRVLTLEELTELTQRQTVAIDTNTKNIEQLDNRVRRIEESRPGPAVNSTLVASSESTKSPTAVSASGNASLSPAELKPASRSLVLGYSSGSAGGSTAFLPAASNFAPVSSAGSTGGSVSYSTSYGVSSRPVAARTRTVTRTRPGILGRWFGATETVRVPIAKFAPAYTSIATGDPVFCVDANGNQVPCN